MQDLRLRLSDKPPRMPSWLHVQTNSVSRIIAALDYWINLNKSVSRALEMHEFSNPIDYTDALMSASSGIINGIHCDIIGGRKENQHAVFSAILKTMPDRELMNAPFVPQGMNVTEARRFVDERHDDIVNSMVRSFDKVVINCLEQKWYKETKVFLPPPELMERHPNFDAYTQLHHAEELPDDTRSKVGTLSLHRQWAVISILF